MSTREEQNKELVRRFYKAFEKNDRAALEEILAPGLVAFSHGQPGPQDREKHMQGIRSWNAAFPDTHFEIEEQVAERDQVTSKVILRATHSGGEFQGLAPTGKQIAIPATSVERIRDGRIIERRVNSDWSEMLRQLGVAQVAKASR